MGSALVRRKGESSEGKDSRLRADDNTLLGRDTDRTVATGTTDHGEIICLHLCMCISA